MKENDIKKHDYKCINLVVLLVIFIVLLIFLIIMIIIVNQLVAELSLVDEHLTSNLVKKTLNNKTHESSSAPGLTSTRDIYNDNLIFTLLTNALSTSTISTFSKVAENEFEEFETSCGTAHYESDMIKNYRVNKRIINGEEAIPHSYPWVVSLYELNNGMISTHFCAGTLITTRHVVTAAHCVIPFNKMTRNEKSEMNDMQYDQYLKTINSKKILVVVGLHTHDKTNSTENFYVVSNFSFHQDFSMAPCCQDDISILELEKSVTINKKVNTICLPFSLKTFKHRLRELVNNDLVTVVGWGRQTHSSHQHAYSLKQAILRIKTGDVICNTSKFWHTNTVYCLQDEVKNSAICNADSGGPIMYFHQKRWYIIGIISHFSVNKDTKNLFHFQCLPHNPSFSVKLDVYAEWIKKHL